jgi:hypothetical protein
MIRGPEAVRRAIGSLLTDDVNGDGIEAALREHEVDALGQRRAGVVQVDCVAAGEASRACPGVDEAGAGEDPVGARVASRVRLFIESPAGFGYLLKDRVLDVDDFVDALRRVARGGTAIDPAVVGQLLGRTRPDDPIATHTERERAC